MILPCLKLSLFHGLKTCEKPLVSLRSPKRQSLRETLPFVTIGKMRSDSSEIMKLLREYNDLTARLQRGTSPNADADRNRIRELISLISKLRNQRNTLAQCEDGKQHS